MIMSPLHSLHINTRMHILIAVFYIQGHTNRKIPWRGNVSQYNAVYVQSHIQLWYLRQGQGREAAQVFPTSHHWLFMSRFFLNIQLSCVKYFFLMVPLGLTMVPMSLRDVFFSPFAHSTRKGDVHIMYVLFAFSLWVWGGESEWQQWQWKHFHSLRQHFILLHSCDAFQRLTLVFPNIEMQCSSAYLLALTW